MLTQRVAFSRREGIEPDTRRMPVVIAVLQVDQQAAATTGVFVTSEETRTIFKNHHCGARK